LPTRIAASAIVQPDARLLRRNEFTEAPFGALVRAAFSSGSFAN